MNTSRSAMESGWAPHPWHEEAETETSRCETLARFDLARPCASCRVQDRDPSTLHAFPPQGTAATSAVRVEMMPVPFKSAAMSAVPAALLFAVRSALLDCAVISCVAEEDAGRRV